MALQSLTHPPLRPHSRSQDCTPSKAKVASAAPPPPPGSPASPKLSLSSSISTSIGMPRSPLGPDIAGSGAAEATRKENLATVARKAGAGRKVQAADGTRGRKGGTQRRTGARPEPRPEASQATPSGRAPPPSALRLLLSLPSRVPFPAAGPPVNRGSTHRRPGSRDPGPLELEASTRLHPTASAPSAWSESDRRFPRLSIASRTLFPSPFLPQMTHNRLLSWPYHFS